MKKVDLRNIIRPVCVVGNHKIASGPLPPGKAIEIIGLDAGSLHDLQCIISSDSRIITTIGVGPDCDGDIAVRIEKSGAV